jgi:hypothetical protein
LAQPRRRIHVVNVKGNTAMKLSTILAASLAATVLSMPAGAAVPSMPQLKVNATSAEPVGMVWRCGKNNPAWWGTFGNGCLKQKRAAKKGSAATGIGGFTAGKPTAPPRRSQLAN